MISVYVYFEEILVCFKVGRIDCDSEIRGKKVSVFAQIWLVEVLGGEMISRDILRHRFVTCFSAVARIWWVEILGGEVVSIRVNSKRARFGRGLVCRV